MPTIRDLYVAQVVLQLLLSAGLFLYACSRMRQTGAVPLALLFASAFQWILGIGMCTLSPSLTAARAWFDFRGVGLYLATPAFYTVVESYVNRPRRYSPAWIALVWTVNVVGAASFALRLPLVGTYELFEEGGLVVWRTSSLLPFGYVLRLWLWGLAFGGLARLVRHASRTRGSERRGTLLVALGIGGVIVVNLMRDFGLLAPFPTAMAVPLSLNLMCAAFGLAVYRYRWLDLSPLARNVIDAVPDPVFVQSLDGCLLLVNEAYCRWVGRSADEIVGRADRELFPPAVVEAWRTADRSLIEGGCRSALQQTFHEQHDSVMITHRSLYRDRFGDALVVGVMRDVTALQDVKGELERKVVDLERALAEVKRSRASSPCACTARTSATIATTGDVSRPTSAATRMPFSATASARTATPG